MNAMTIKPLAAMIMASMFLLWGCVKEVQQPVPEQEDLHEVVFHAGWDAETKAVLQEDGKVFWSPGDEISLFVGDGTNGGYKLTSTNTEPVAKTDFIGQVEEYPNNVHYVAIYPYKESTSIDGNKVWITFPDKQTAKEGTFDKNAFVSIAQSDNETLYFHNICSGIKFSVVNDGIKEIDFSLSQDTFHPDCGMGLSGQYVFDMENNTGEGFGSSKITIESPDEHGFTPGKNYYAVIPAATFHNGLRITYKKDESEATIVLDGETTFKPSVFKRLLNKDSGLMFQKRAMSHGTIVNFGSLLTGGVDPKCITEVHFYTQSSTTTSTILDSHSDSESEPVYFELDGTIANYYTKGETFKVIRAQALFEGWESLHSVDLSNFDFSSCVDFSEMFWGCSSLTQIEFGDINTSNVKSMGNMFFGCLSLETLDLSAFSTSNVAEMGAMFDSCVKLRELNLSSFDTQSLENMSYMFNNCYRLENLNISSFSSARLSSVSFLFANCYSMLNLNMENIDLSSVSDSYNLCSKFTKRSRNCAILCTPETKTALLSSMTNNQAQYMQWFVPGQTLPTLSMNDGGLYYSTDFSKDKKVKMLNEATSGAGIDVVIMGEAYSDRLIENGTYEEDMRSAMEQIFSIEPFKSYRNLFNIHMVYAVSDNEEYNEFTAFGYAHDAWFGNGGVDRDDLAINEYVSQAVGRSEDRQVTTVIVVNALRNNGVAMINTADGGVAESDHYDYPARLAGVAFIEKSEDSERFRYTVCHEFGHAFAALHDEYVDYEGEMESWESDSKKYYQTHAGWYANVDFTSDPNLVRWKHFMTPGTPYDESQVSIIEGALYAKGIWKSVNQSMMNAGGEYSVPSREAIYKKIHKTAFGDSWQYDFDTFVQQDLEHIAPTTKATAVKYVPYPARVNKRPLFKMEESTTPDGKKMITVIMD